LQARFTGALAIALPTLLVVPFLVTLTGCGRSTSFDPIGPTAKPDTIELIVGRRGWDFYASDVGQRRPFFTPVRDGDDVPLSIGPAGGHFAVLTIRIEGGVPQCPPPESGRSGCLVKADLHSETRPEIDVKLERLARFELVDGGLEARLMIPFQPDPIEPADAELNVSVDGIPPTTRWSTRVHLIEGCELHSRDCAPMQFCASGLCQACAIECAEGAAQKGLECHDYGQGCTAWVEPPPS